ncbi:hypothetical protein B0H17DRAFT_1026729 [Mycena rosella]|uniref:BTB domain-containing protein n=1 Tax=Mycena rosella TaxID=1033263 RepID=A0AAD7F871_MYCRO|nr:hypothetical protein B0H17DRAFT_1026729 [Mycena rosella]
MALHKLGDDEWTASGVKSTFTITIPEDPASRIPASLTAICGWGWRFSCSIDPASSTTSPILMTSDSSRIPWRRVTVFFHPDLICGAAYGRITFLTDVKNLLPLDNAPFFTEFDLPDHRANPPLGIYMHRSDAPGPATVAISVVIRSALGISLPQPLDSRVEEALADTIRGDEVVDVKFYAYTQRVGGSCVVRPRAMYAKMALLRGHSGDLDAYISGRVGFTESAAVDLDQDVFEEWFTEYDYLSDSDLDSAEEEDGVRALDPSHNAPSTQGTSTDQPYDSNTVPIPPSRPNSPFLKTPRRMGHVVSVKGHAYKTWNALLYYLYTNKIVFRASADLGPRMSRVSPECSAKSMYKLADVFGLDELKSLALASLRSHLSPNNIVREAFSSFTSVYPEIQHMEVEFLIRHLPALTGEIDKILKSVCDGARPHCFDVLRKVVRWNCDPSIRPPIPSLRSRRGSIDSYTSPRGYHIPTTLPDDFYSTEAG